MNSRASVFILLVHLTLAPLYLASAHEGEAHPSSDKHQAIPTSDVSEKIIKSINESYSKNVQSIFRKSCFDCHSNQTTFPWYANLPGIKQLIASDTAGAKTHLDMSDGFPFKSHGSPKEDLFAIRKAVSEESMPPLRYWILHGDSKLNEDEKKIVLDWLDQSLKLLPAR